MTSHVNTDRILQLARVGHHGTPIELFDQSGITRQDILHLVSQEKEESLYMVDLAEISRRYSEWKRLLPNVRPYYAVKCNPDPVILRMLLSLGASFDCASWNEIALVQEQGEVLQVKTDILFANPCKDLPSLRYARKTGVQRMTFDCGSELHKIKTHYPEALLLMRIQTDDSHSACRFNCKFGVSIENNYKDVRDLLQLAQQLNLNVKGVSFHVGSGCTSFLPYQKGIVSAMEVFTQAKEYGFTLDVLDIGGGFPGKEEGVTFQEIALAIQEQINESVPPDIEVIAEPGRYMVATAATLITRVIGKKESMVERRFSYTLNDGIYGAFNGILFDHQSPEAIPLHKRGKLYPSTLFGPTCDSLDLVNKMCMLPELEIGDRCAFENMGAYSTASASTFNGFVKASSHYVYII